MFAEAGDAISLWPVSNAEINDISLLIVVTSASVVVVVLDVVVLVVVAPPAVLVVVELVEVVELEVDVDVLVVAPLEPPPPPPPHAVNIVAINTEITKRLLFLNNANIERAPICVARNNSNITARFRN
jgi:hypothetical protein